MKVIETNLHHPDAATDNLLRLWRKKQLELWHSKLADGQRGALLTEQIDDSTFCTLNDDAHGLGVLVLAHHTSP